MNRPMTAQDQQSRAEFERELIANRHFKPADFCFLSGDYTGNDDVQFAWAVWQAARALPARGVDPMLDTPAGMEPGWFLHTLDITDGIPGNTLHERVTKEKAPPFGEPGRDYSAEYPATSTPLYTAAQVLALLAHRGHGEGANQPQTRMDAGAGPGRGLPPADGQVDCIGLALELESQAKRVESQSVERAMAAAAQALRLLVTTEPQAPTTGAGSVTAGAAPETSQLTGEEMIRALEWRDQQWALHRSRIGLECSCCKDGKYRSDSNGYNTFLRCDKCLHVPMWNEAGNEFGPHIK